MPNTKHRLTQLVHDLAGSLTVLTICLPQLEEQTSKEPYILCQTAVGEAKQKIHQLQDALESFPD